jgi:hypothetical protein
MSGPSRLKPLLNFRIDDTHSVITFSFRRWYHQQMLSDRFKSKANLRILLVSVTSLLLRHPCETLASPPTTSQATTSKTDAPKAEMEAVLAKISQLPPMLIVDDDNPEDYRRWEAVASTQPGNPKIDGTNNDTYRWSLARMRDSLSDADQASLDTYIDQIILTAAKLSYDSFVKDYCRAEGVTPAFIPNDIDANLKSGSVRQGKLAVRALFDGKTWPEISKMGMAYGPLFQQVCGDVQQGK